MTTRASIALYLAEQRASSLLSDNTDTPVFLDHAEYLDIEIRRAAMENVRPDRLPGTFPWKS